MASQAALKIPLSRRRLINIPTTDSPKLVDLLQTNPLPAQSTDSLPVMTIDPLPVIPIEPPSASTTDLPSTQGTDPTSAKPTDPLISLQDEQPPVEEFEQPTQGVKATREFTHRNEIDVEGKHIHKDVGQLSFGVFDGMLAVISLVFFYVDWVNKILLIRSYFITGKTMAGILTTVFATAPTLVTTLMGLRWYYNDYLQQKASAKTFNTTQRTSKTLWTVRVVMTLLLQGNVIR